MRRVLTLSTLAILLASTLGAAPGQITSDSKAKVTPVSSQKAQDNVSKPYQVGKASWYGDIFQGKPTASGEAYDMYDYTAAHPTLPLGTWVRVTNLTNQRSIIVRINDRGPVVPGRIIDLSYYAAKSLKMSQRGIAKVRLDLVKDSESEPVMAEQRPPQVGIGSR